MQKGNVLIFLLVGIVVLAAIGGAFYLGRSTLLRQDFAGQATPQPSPSPVATSQVATSPNPNTNPIPNGTGETASWKTYTNKKVGFSISYPENWILEENPLDDQLWTGIQISLQSPEDVKHNANPLADFGNGLFLYIYDNPKRISIDDFIREDWQITDPSMMQWEPYTVGNMQGRQYNLPGCCAGEDIFLSTDKYIFYFADMTDPKIFKAILSNFRSD